MQGVSLAVIPQPGSNWVEITDEFYRRFAQIQKELPADMVISIGIDKSKFVRRALSEVTETLFIAIGARGAYHLPVFPQLAHCPAPLD